MAFANECFPLSGAMLGEPAVGAAAESLWSIMNDPPLLSMESVGLEGIAGDASTTLLSMPHSLGTLGVSALRGGGGAQGPSVDAEAYADGCAPLAEQKHVALVRAAVQSRTEEIMESFRGHAAAIVEANKRSEQTFCARRDAVRQARAREWRSNAALLVVWVCGVCVVISAPPTAMSCLPLANQRAPL